MFDQAMARIAGRYRRVEPRATARAFVLGLLSGFEPSGSRRRRGTPPPSSRSRPRERTTAGAWPRAALAAAATTGMLVAAGFAVTAVVRAPTSQG